MEASVPCLRSLAALVYSPAVGGRAGHRGHSLGGGVGVARVGPAPKQIEKTQRVTTYDVVVSQYTRNLGSLWSLSKTSSSIKLESSVDGTISFSISGIWPVRKDLFFLLQAAMAAVLDL